MAISRVIRTQLRLVFEEGNDLETGNVILKTKSFANVQEDVTPDQLYSVGTALAALQSFPLYRIERYDHSEVSAE